MSEVQQPPFDKSEITANSLKIARENRSNPVVREFVDFVNQVEDLQMDLSQASVRAARPEKYPGEEFVPPHEMDVLPSLKDRYSSAELMMRAVSFILRDGFAGETFIQDDPRRQEYVASRVNSALARYGLEVVKKVEPTPVEDNPVNPRSRFKVIK